MKRLVLAMAAAAVMVGAGCGKSETAKVQDALRYNPSFSQTEYAASVKCQPDGHERGKDRFRCLASTDTAPHEWLYDPTGDVSLITDGGEEHSPPADAGAAAQRMEDVAFHNSGQRVVFDCQPFRLSDGSIAGPNNYVCHFMAPPTGLPFTLSLGWIQDGTLSLDLLSRG